MNLPEDTVEIRRAAAAALRRIEKRGVRHVYVNSSRSKGDAVIADNARSIADVMSVPQALQALSARVAECTQCPLHEARTKTVFGVGTHETRVMFIGEAPGRDEDLKGEPFVGRAGQLLTKIIAAIDLTREQVYITNILKCRPPKNRDPQESEVRCCEDFLKQQIALIRPRYICALGRVAAHWLLQTDAPLAAMRTGEYFYEGIPVIVTYHPAALLRNSNFKRPCWEDMKKLKSLIDAC